MSENFRDVCCLHEPVYLVFTDSACLSCADWWECAIITRKLVLSIITKYSVTGTEGSIRQSLCNMAVMLVASTAHVYARPFAHSDANMAEMATLFSTMLILLVGLGTIQVTDDDGKPINDPKEQDKALSVTEEGAFYVIIYILMSGFCVGTIAIIMRRIGGAYEQFKRGSNRPFKAPFLPPEHLSCEQLRELAKSPEGSLSAIPEQEVEQAIKECSEHGSSSARITAYEQLFDQMQSDAKVSRGTTGLTPAEVVAGTQELQFYPLPSLMELQELSGDLDERIERHHFTKWCEDRYREEQKKMAVIDLLRKHYEDDDLTPPPTGLPDEIAEMIAKNKLEAAVAWFNEREDNPSLKNGGKIVRARYDADGSKVPVLTESGRFRGTFRRASPDDEYKVKDTQILQLIQCIRKYKTFIDDTQFTQRHKFANMFSDAGYKGNDGKKQTGRYGLYAWLGSIKDPGELKPLLGFLTCLDECGEKQMWATVPRWVEEMVNFCVMSGRARDEKEEKKEFQLAVFESLPSASEGSASMRETIQQANDDMQDMDDRKLNAKRLKKRWWQNLTIETVWYHGTKFFERHPFLISAGLGLIYFSLGALWIRSQAQMCCLGTLGERSCHKLTRSTDIIACLSETRHNKDVHGKPMLGANALLSDPTGEGKYFCSRTPDQSCKASCDEGYFPTTVLRRQAEQLTRNEEYTCNNQNVTNLGLILGYSSPPFWDHTGAAGKDTVPSFACVKPVPIDVNGAVLQRQIESEDEQLWFSFDAKRGVKYKVSVDLFAGQKDWLEDSVVCVFISMDQHAKGGQALDEQECTGENGGPPCHSVYCNDDTSVSLGSQMKWTEDTDRPRYIAVYGRRKDEKGLFNISVSTSCPAPNDKVADTSEADQIQRMYLTDTTTGDDTGWYDDPQSPDKPCTDSFVRGASGPDTCSFVCADGYVPLDKSNGESSRAVRVCKPPPCNQNNCTQDELNQNGAFDDNRCIRKQPEPEPEPELEPEPEPEPQGLFEETPLASPIVDWVAHQRALREALEAAALIPPLLADNDEEGQFLPHKWTATGSQLRDRSNPCPEDSSADEEEACGWNSAMAELQQLAKTLDAAALRAEVWRIRSDRAQDDEPAA